MSLLDQAYEKYVHAEVPVRDAESPTLEAKEPRSRQQKSQNVVQVDWGDNPLVQSVDKRSKELRESPDELREAAADDWSEVSNDPAQLVAFADSLAIVQIRESGYVPDHYNFVTNCQNCGDVPVYPGLPQAIEQCPWCMNGLTPPPIPDSQTDRK